MNNSGTNSLKASVFASLALAFASFGDAFLYAFLPVNSFAVGVPLLWVGILLSVNRFVRIFSNAVMVHFISKHGLRPVMITAVLLAIFSTLGYGIAAHVFVWLFFRVCWGLAFSAIKISTLGYALENSDRGTAFGISRSLQEAGPMVALLIAPFLLQNLNTTKIFFSLAALSAPSLYFAWSLPARHTQPAIATPRWSLRWPSVLNSITFLSAIVIDGIIVVVLGILFLKYRDNISLLMATSLAAFYLGYRRICLVILSPAGGWIADKIGLDKVFNLSIASIIVGLLLVVSGWIATGAIIVFTFYSIHAAITPASVTKGQLHSLAAVAENTTWRDFGAGLGTIVGGALLASEYLTGILLVAIMMLSLLLLIHFGPIRTTKLLHLWK